MGAWSVEIATRPVSQSTSTSNLRSPAATVMRPPLLPPSGKKRMAPTLSSTRSFCAVKSFSVMPSGSLCTRGSLSRRKRLPATSTRRNASRRCASASLRAIRRPAASWRAELRSWVVDTPLPSIGSVIAVINAMRARTMRSSSRVKPCSRGRDGTAYSRLVMSLFTPSPPSLPSAP
jgi:hypothetical protein